MDALSIGMQRRSKEKKGIKSYIYASEYRRLLRYERIIFEYFENKIIISKQDQAFIIHPDYKKIKIVPNGIDAKFFEVIPQEKKYELVFVGNMSYAPNISATKYLAAHILPQVPELKCLIAGANPSKEILKLATKNMNQITVSGWIDDVREAYQSGKIFFAPMQSGTGLQNKLLEAMAQGIPCITTTIANNGIEAENDEILLVADTPEAQIEAIKRLLNDAEKRNSMALNAKKWVHENFSWSETVYQLHQIMEN
jgi:glycosyltransferase involved in cell wall biosynthesis